MRIQETESDASSVIALLEERLYEYNVEATGVGDGRSLCFVVHADDGGLVAGLGGYTWGRCCDIKALWVDRGHRGQGLGRALMAAAEAEATRRDCAQIVVLTHSFQAPGFYEKLGFHQVGAVLDYPRDHALVLYVKSLSRQ